MKRTMFHAGAERWAVGVCLLGMLVPCAWAAEPAETFRFENTCVGNRLTNQFLLRNDGLEAVKVLSATPSCDCIRVLRFPAQVEAGATGVVEVLFVPDKAGEVDYRVYVRTAVTNQPEIEFAIQGVVAAAPPRAKADRDWALYLATEEAQQIIRHPDAAVIVDVRNPTASARIPDALQMPLHAMKTKGFLKNRPVVLVDEGYGSSALEEECRKLRGMGFSNLSIWYGGLNAWQRRGGRLEGGETSDFNRIPPVALHDIAFSTDWLVVAADGEATNHLAGAIPVIFDASRKEGFVSALEAALAERPQVTAVLIVTKTGADYGAIAETAGTINALVFYLEGGWDAWTAHRQMMEAIQQSRTVVVQHAGGGGVVRPGGCGGCSK